MDRFFTSDIHLGHKTAARYRGFDSVEEHDEAVIQSFLDMPRRSKLWVLGDIVVHTTKGYDLLEEFSIRVPSQRKAAVLGNHDELPISAYANFFDDVHGAISYKNFWLTHIPIHEQEMCHRFGLRGNIHGHIHKGAATPELPLPWFNVNWDFHRGPVPFEVIDNAFKQHEET